MAAAQLPPSRLTPISDTKDKRGRPAVVCQCVCGNTVTVTRYRLASGHTRSCGCLSRETAAANARRTNTKHGLCRSKVSIAWSGMRDRCNNPKNASFHNYGGRGIRVCERWSDFLNFVADMGHPPSKAHSLDRIDVNGNYEPSNCRWATAKEQCRNTRDTVYLTAFGETRTAADWAEDSRCSVSRDRIYARLALGWSHEDAIAMPSGQTPRARSFAKVKVMQALSAASLTDSELATATGLRFATAQRRRAELRSKGLVVAAGERDGSTIWRAK